MTTLRRLLLGLMMAAVVPTPALADPGARPLAPEPTTLRFCFEETPALPWRSRQKVGLYFDLLEAVAQRLELRFEYHPQPWRYCLAEVAAGRMDGAFAVALSPERRAVFAYPPGAPDEDGDVLRIDSIVLVRRKGTSVTVVGDRLLGTDKPVGVLPAYAVADDLARMGWPLDTASRDHVAQLARLRNGELDAIALSAFRWDQLRAAGGIALDSLEALPEPLMTKRHFLGLSHPFVAAHPELAQRLWTTTRELRTSDWYREREAAAVTEALTPRVHP